MLLWLRGDLAVTDPTEQETRGGSASAKLLRARSQNHNRVHLSESEEGEPGRLPVRSPRGLGCAEGGSQSVRAPGK